MPLVVAVLVFTCVTTLIVGAWVVLAPARQVRERLGRPAGAAEVLETRILKPATTYRGPIMSLTGLVEQAGYSFAATDLLLVVALFGIAGGTLGAFRMGGPTWAPVAAVASASLPLAYLWFKRQQRLGQFQRQLPDAMDMMTRSIRAGHALPGALRLVGEEMQPPIGPAFLRVSEEIRLGLDPAEAIAGLERRVPTDDVRFFCTAVSIQRTTGGNLAEVLERLAEVVRERFKLLSHARALSAQHKWAAILVGLSPIAFAIIFQLIRPGYFDDFLASPSAPRLIGLGLLSEAIGFLFIWRISQLKI